MSFLTIEKMSANPDDWQILIHVPKALWNEIAGKDKYFLAHIVLHELLEGVLSSQEQMTKHRFAGILSTFLRSDKVKEFGVNDLDLWYLENGSVEYLRHIDANYQLQQDPTLGAFHDQLWAIARKRGIHNQLNRTKKITEWPYEFSGDYAVFTTYGTRPLSENQRKRLATDYAGKGTLVEVPDHVLSWIEKQKIGKSYDPLVRLIRGNSDKNRLVFKIDEDLGNEYYYRFPESKGKRRGDVLFFVARPTSQKGHPIGPIEIHMTRATWNKISEEAAVKPKEEAGGLREDPKVKNFIKWVRANMNAIIEKGSFAFDVDGTLVPKITGKTLADQPELMNLLIEMMQKKIRIAIISGHSEPKQMKDVIIPLQEELKKRGQPELLSWLTLYINGGATKLQFIVRKNVYDFDYNRDHSMTLDEANLFAEVMRKYAIEEKLSLDPQTIARWRAYAEREYTSGMDMSWMDGNPDWKPSFVTAEEIDKIKKEKIPRPDISFPWIEIRGQGLGGPGSISNFTLKPLPKKEGKDVRGSLLVRLTEALGPEKAAQFGLRLAGTASIDVTSSKANKIAALMDHIESNNLDPEFVFYFGDEFYSRQEINEEGQPFTNEGNDEPLTRIPGIHTLAINEEEPTNSKAEYWVGHNSEEKHVEGTTQFLEAIFQEGEMSDEQPIPAATTFLAEMLVYVYVQNFLPADIEGLDRDAWAGLNTLHFATQTAKNKWINDLRLFNLDIANETNDVRYLYEILWNYNMARDVQGNFRRTLFDHMNDLYSKVPELFVHGVRNVQDFTSFYGYLLEEHLATTNLDKRLEALTPILESAAKTNPLIRQILDDKRYVQTKELLNGTTVYMLQSINAFLDFFAVREDVENFIISDEKIGEIHALRKQFDQSSDKLGELNRMLTQWEEKILRTATATDADRKEADDLRFEIESINKTRHYLRDEMDKLWGGKYPIDLNESEIEGLRLTPKLINEMHRYERIGKESIQERKLRIEEYFTLEASIKRLENEIKNGATDKADQLVKLKDALKALKEKIDRIHENINKTFGGDVAGIWDRPFAEWMYREVHSLTKGKTGNKLVTVAVLGGPGTGKTTVTGIALNRLAIGFNDIGPVADSKTGNYILDLEYDEANDPPEAKFKWGPRGFIVNFVGSDPYLKPSAIRYKKLAGNSRYTILGGAEIYDDVRLDRMLTSLRNGRETLAPKDDHAPHNTPATTFDEVAHTGRRSIPGETLRVLIKDMTIFGTNPRLARSIDLLIPAIFQDDAERLARRIDRDALPKPWGSRGDSEAYVIGDHARKQVVEGLWYELPLLREKLAKGEEIIVWIHDQNKLVRLKKKNNSRSEMRTAVEDANLLMDQAEELETAIAGETIPPAVPNLYTVSTKKAPGTQPMSSAEEQFLLELYDTLATLQRNDTAFDPGANHELFTESVAIDGNPLFESIYPLMAKAFGVDLNNLQRLLESASAEPTTFGERLLFLLKKDRIRFMVDRLGPDVRGESSNPFKAIKALASNRYRTTEIINDEFLFPRLTPMENPIGVMAFTAYGFENKNKEIITEIELNRMREQLSKMKKEKGDSNPAVLELDAKVREFAQNAIIYIHVPRALWNQQKNNPYFMAQLIVAEAAESLMGTPDRITRHRQSGLLEMYLLSPHLAQATGVSDLNMWFLNHAALRPEIPKLNQYNQGYLDYYMANLKEPYQNYLKLLHGKYNKNIDPTMGSFYTQLVAVARQAGVSLGRPKPDFFNPTAMRLNKYLKKAPATPDVSPADVLELEEKYKGKLHDGILQHISGENNRIDAPQLMSDVSAWIFNNRVGKIFDGLNKMIHDNTISFVVDPTEQEDAVFFPRPDKSDAPGILFFPTLAEDNTYEIHITKGLWTWLEKQTQEKRISFLAQIMVFTYAQNVLPVVDGLGIHVLAGMLALHFGTEEARKEGVNDLDLFYLDWAESRRDYGYFLRTIWKYRSTLDQMGTFKQAVYKRIYSLEVTTGGTSEILNSIQSAPELLAYYSYLFEYKYNKLFVDAKESRVQRIAKEFEDYAAEHPDSIVAKIIHESNRALLKEYIDLPAHQQDNWLQDRAPQFMFSGRGVDPKVFSLIPQNLGAFLSWLKVEGDHTLKPLTAEQSAQLRAAQQDLAEVEEPLKRLTAEWYTLRDLIKKNPDDTLLASKKDTIQSQLAYYKERIKMAASVAIPLTFNSFIEFTVNRIAELIAERDRQGQSGPIVIALYGLSSTGKTTLVDLLVNALKARFGNEAVAQDSTDAYSHPKTVRQIGGQTVIAADAIYDLAALLRNLHDFRAGGEIYTRPDPHAKNEIDRHKFRKIDGNEKRILVLDMTAFGWDRQIDTQVDMFIPILFADDRSRLARRVIRDIMPGERELGMEALIDDMVAKQFVELYAKVIEVLLETSSDANKNIIFFQDIQKLARLDTDRADESMQPESSVESRRSEVRELPPPSTADAPSPSRPDTELPSTRKPTAPAGLLEALDSVTEMKRDLMTPLAHNLSLALNLSYSDAPDVDGVDVIEWTKAYSPSHIQDLLNRTPYQRKIAVDISLKSVDTAVVSALNQLQQASNGRLLIISNAVNLSAATREAGKHFEVDTNSAEQIRLPEEVIARAEAPEIRLALRAASALSYDPNKRRTLAPIVIIGSEQVDFAQQHILSMAAILQALQETLSETLATEKSA